MHTAFLSLLGLLLFILPYLSWNDDNRLAQVFDGKQEPKSTFDYDSLPLAFEPNQGQSNPRVQFLARARNYSVFLTSREAVVMLHGPACKPDPTRSLRTRRKPSFSIVRMSLIGAGDHPSVTAENELPGTSSYFIGRDVTKWHTGVRQYATVRYANVYPGIDMLYYGRGQDLEHDFIVHPGVDPRLIRLSFTGATVELKRGELTLTTAMGSIHLRPPRIYQQVDGNNSQIQGAYELTARHEVRFRVGPYDPSSDLIIDPVLSYSTLLGGTWDEHANSIAVDAAGNVYVAGETVSADFPVASAVLSGFQGTFDLFVTKLNRDGSAIEYSAFFPGAPPWDAATGIAVDLAGNAYITGTTHSREFPLVHPLYSQMDYSGNAFVTKINARGNSLLYSTYLGGGREDYGKAIAVDQDGNAYVTGLTYSPDFPLVNALQPGVASFGRGFVSKLNATGTMLVYSTYLGGNTLATDGHSIAVDSTGSAYIAGSTWATDFPTINALQPTSGGGGDAFVMKLDPHGSAFVYSTYLGGSSFETAEAIAVDGMGNAYVVGRTASADFPTANAMQTVFRGWDAFVTKISPSGNAFVYSTFLGGSAYDNAAGVAVDPAGNAYVAGYTASADFPIMNSVPSEPFRYSKPFLAKMNEHGALLYSTFVANEGAQATAVALDAAGSAYVTGSTNSSGFPTTLLAFQRRTSHTDAFILKVAEQTAIAVLPVKADFLRQAVGTTSSPKNITVTNGGTAAVRISRIYVAGANPGDFRQFNTCVPEIRPGSTCTIQLVFAPTAKNTRRGVLGISHSDPGSPAAIPVTGIATVIALSRQSLSFGNQLVGTRSLPQNITVTNLGTTPVNFTAMTIVGRNVSEFSQANTCGTGIAGGASCTISVTFTPTLAGIGRATLNIMHDGGGSPQPVLLAGTGIS